MMNQFINRAGNTKYNNRIATEIQSPQGLNTSESVNFSKDLNTQHSLKSKSRGDATANCFRSKLQDD